MKEMKQICLDVASPTLINFLAQKNHQNEPKFNGAHS